MRGVEQIVAELVNGQTTSLDASYARLNASDMMRVAAALEANITLQSLELYASGVGDEGAALLVSALEKNTTLQSLNLSNNVVGDAGAASLASALEKNDTLQSLNLYANDVGDAGAVSLASALEKNTTLQSLDLLDNPMDNNMFVVKAIQAMLRANRAEAKLKSTTSELDRWRRGELRFVPEVINVDTGEMVSTTIAVDREHRLPKRPRVGAEAGAAAATPGGGASSSLSQMIELSQHNTTIKEEVAEALRGKREAQEKLDDLEQCVVCMERPRTVVLRPCCHFVCCAICARGQTECPATGCKSSIHSRLQGICAAPHVQQTAF